MSYYDDVNISIVAATRFQLGLMNKLLLTTGEDDIDDDGKLLKLSGATAKAELEEWLTANSKVAPKLVKAVELATSQQDSSGNVITPQYIYVAGAKITDYSTAIDVSALTTLIQDNTSIESEWWMLVPVEYNLKYNEWAQTFVATYSKTLCMEINDKTYVPVSNEKLNRIIAIYNGKQDGTGDEKERTDEYFNAAWAGRCVTPEALTAWKFKTLIGCTGYTQDELTTAEVNTLETNLINTYLYRYGRDTTDGSFTTLSNTDYIDTMFKRDNIVANMRYALFTWLSTQEHPTVFDTAEIQAVMERVLNFAVDKGFIAVVDNVSQYRVTVPQPTEQEAAERHLKNVSFEFTPNESVEKITITGEELLVPFLPEA